MKKALVYNKDYLNNKVGDILRIGEASEISSFKHWMMVNKILKVMDVDSEGVPVDCLEVVEVPQVVGVEGSLEHWTNGVDIVYDVNDIPTLVDGEGYPYLDPEWVHVDAVESIQSVPAHKKITKKANADQSLREVKMQQLRVLREPLLQEADIKINTLMDTDADASSWRSYRQELREITEPFKKVNGDWKASVDALVVEEFQFPSKPE